MLSESNNKIVMDLSIFSSSFGLMTAKLKYLFTYLLNLIKFWICVEPVNSKTEHFYLAI